MSTRALLIELHRTPPDIDPTAILPINQENIKHYQQLLRRANKLSRVGIHSITTSDTKLLLLAPRHDQASHHTLEDEDPTATTIGEHTLISMPDDRFFDWYAIKLHQVHVTAGTDGTLRFHQPHSLRAGPWSSKHAITGDSLKSILK